MRLLAASLASIVLSAFLTQPGLAAQTAKFKPTEQIKKISTSATPILSDPSEFPGTAVADAKHSGKAASNPSSSEAHEHVAPIVTKGKVQSHPAPGTHPSKAAPPTAQPAPASTAKQVVSADKHVALDGVPAETSLKWLTNGNARFTKKRFRTDGRAASDRQRLLAGQKPHAIVLSCADSRVPPEIVFDQALGEIFTVRVAGEALDSSVIASIEYAIEHLGSHLLVVMGHTQCGAVDAAMKTKEGDPNLSESLGKLLADIRPRLKSADSQKVSAKLEVESALNADGVARDLVQRSEVIRNKVEAGQLVIKPALYRMDSGKVTFY